MDTLIVQNFGRRLVYALCNAPRKEHCTVDHNYVTGRSKPHYPVPAIHSIPPRMLRSMELNGVEISDYDLFMVDYYNAIY